MNARAGLGHANVNISLLALHPSILHVDIAAEQLTFLQCFISSGVLLWPKSELYHPKSIPPTTPQKRTATLNMRLERTLHLTFSTQQPYC